MTNYTVYLLFTVATVLSLAPVRGQEPALPEGLGDTSSSSTVSSQSQDTEPALPSGLDGGPEEPSLPAGLTNEREESPAKSLEKEDDQPRLLSWPPPLNVTGFLDSRLGYRTVGDDHQNAMSLGEFRLQLETSRQAGPFFLTFAADLLYDYENNDHGIDLERGEGWFDLREANAGFTPFSFMDIKLGRQVLTWGTGDLIFINDMFPKDWNSFFIGRDTEYLKAPSDAAKLSMYFDRAPNVDLIVTGRFDADRFVDGRRVSFWNPMLQRRSGQDNPIDVDKPDEWIKDSEIAVRLFKNIQGYELAAYAYRGFWKSPNGMNPATGEFTFPDLSVYGASVRGTVLAGIGYIETGYYDSRNDRDGDDPTVANCEVHLLAGYEQELWNNMTATAQYYIKHMMDHDEYLESLPPGFQTADETRHTVTLRLHQTLLRETLDINVFTRYSPTNNDMYIRPVVNYELTDNWFVEVGANFFLGNERHTFLNQFDRNDNIYVATRYSF
ncbi:MAG: hypothetical protein K9N51_07690 [Candidatus Pacebacteria bacterium]|nr:hypothetical protein [Candidatus Paceibacterota bacterium]